MQSKEASILVVTHKSTRSKNSRMRSALGTNCHSRPILQGCRLRQPPRVQFDAPPRVQFNIGGNEEIPFDAGSPPQLIVKSSTASIQQQQPKPILKQPTVISSKSIVDRVKQRRGTPSSSIAERVAQHTGKLREYRQLLWDPKQKEI
jgi:hypothetical protein